MGVSVLGFFDDITIYVHGNVKENTEKLSKLLAVGTKWARDHYTDIDLGDKGFIHFRAPKQEREKAHETPLLLPDGGVKAPQEEVKLLGITLDSGLNFRSHIKNITSKAQRALQQMWRSGGMLPWLDRRVLSAVIHDLRSPLDGVWNRGLV